MSIQNAIRFLDRVHEDIDFRKRCYGHSGRTALLEHAKAEGYSFDSHEFEDAIHHLLLQCTTESQAYAVRELQSWFVLFPE
ncbi:MAG: Nif11-like leader peptide family natural product precursor [Bacteroidales bacterium]